MFFRLYQFVVSNKIKERKQCDLIIEKFHFIVQCINKVNSNYLYFGFIIYYSAQFCKFNFLVLQLTSCSVLIII